MSYSILLTRSGQSGYVKNYSRTKRRYSLTLNVNEAKKFSTFDRAAGTVDDMMRVLFPDGGAVMQIM